MEGSRLLDGAAVAGERKFEETLRPRRLADFVGQKTIVENLSVYISSAKSRRDVLDHILLAGPPGLGKTTLAHIVAAEMGARIITTSGPVLEKPGDLAAVLTNLEHGDVLFIDEVHRLHPSVEEILYPAMEDFQLDLVVGHGPGARTVRIDLPRFTLIAATTRAGLLTPPLRDRFGIVERLTFYPPEDLASIVIRSARILGIEIESTAAKEIAKRARGTPRVANRLLRRVRDFAIHMGKDAVDVEAARWGLERLAVDSYGLDEMDRRLLEVLIVQFGGGPVGIRALAASLGEDMGTLEEVNEPFLLQAGFIKRTPRGRVATPLAFKHLGLSGAERELPLGDEI